MVRLLCSAALRCATVSLFLLMISTFGLSDTIPYEADADGSAGAACSGVNSFYQEGGTLEKFADGETSQTHSCPDGRSGTASASSTGTTRGSLHALAEASGNEGTGGEATFADAMADASFSNFIDIMPPSNDPLSSGTIIFGMRVDGVLSGDAQATACVDLLEFNIFECKDVNTVSGDQGQVSIVVSAGITLTGPHTPIQLTESLQVSAEANIENPKSSAEFGRTAEAFLELPPGWTFTSASGDFLTATSVPEPGTCTFLAIGLIALLACFRLTRRRTYTTG